MAGQPFPAEPSHSAPKRTSFFPSLRFGEERFRSFRSRRHSAQPTAGRPKAGRPEAARVASNRGMMAVKSTDRRSLTVSQQWHQLSRFDRRMCAHDPRAPRAREGACADADSQARRGRVGAAPLGGGGEQRTRVPQGNANVRGHQERMSDGTGARSTRPQAKVCNARAVGCRASDREKKGKLGAQGRLRG
jgi:hypothetical protein